MRIYKLATMLIAVALAFASCSKSSDDSDSDDAAETENSGDTDGPGTVQLSGVNATVPKEMSVASITAPHSRCSNPARSAPRPHPNRTARARWSTTRPWPWWAG